MPESVPFLILVFSAFMAFAGAVIYGTVVAGDRSKS